MEIWQLRQMADDLGDSRICAYLGIGAATLRRWKTGKARIPQAAAIAIRLYFDGDLAAIGGDDWQGFRFCDNLLFIPGWKYGFKPGEVCAMFFQVQELRHHRNEVRMLHERVEALQKDIEKERFRADEYRALAAQLPAIPVLRLFDLR